MATIVLTGGGTAGHCTPNIALLPYLKKDFDRIVYIGSENGIEKEIVKNANLEYFGVPCTKLKRGEIIKNLSIPFTLTHGIIKAGKILDKIKPDVVFSKGGFVSLPTVISAYRRKIPVISHESDFTVGLANKISARLSKKVLTSFPETAKTLKNGEFVGPPLRKEIFNSNKAESLKNFGFNGRKPILLVTGGSQGAKILNQTIRSALPYLLPKFDVLHICGKNNLIEEKTPHGYIQTEYVNNMEDALSIASVCVSRAGSNTLFELMSLKIPCVLIPLPKGTSRGDQILNANYFEKLGLACVVRQESLSEKSLFLAINSAYSNRLNFLRNFENYPIKDSSRQITRIIADHANSKR